MAVRGKRRSEPGLIKRAVEDTAALLAAWDPSEEDDAAEVELHMLLLKAWVAGHNAVAREPLRLVRTG